MWNSLHLATLYASTVCYGDTFTFLYFFYITAAHIDIVQSQETEMHNITNYIFKNHFNIILEVVTTVQFHSGLLISSIRPIRPKRLIFLHTVQD
jgi:hypothetical protein